MQTEPMIRLAAFAAVFAVTAGWEALCPARARNQTRGRRWIPNWSIAIIDTVEVRPLFHAAAGGVGLIACQWAKAMGLQLIGTAGSDAKCVLAQQNGAAFAINYAKEDFVARVKEITGGVGVKVVYDSVGKDTFLKSLDCLRPFGLIANFGNASGKVEPLDLGLLASKGSLYTTRPTVFTHLATRESTQAMADELFEMVISGKVNVAIDQRFPLADVAEAHRSLEARKTTGCTILTL